ncbi:hypothetical protein DERF_001628 [Dermatophagoides farinae]|uniref:Uncharacterized protein n=1 Tax=Dermatophagoides farinae TaxID=6954 RepID=A0A922L8U4_DERFA|nr:hypothetical protein DERF_001628 [Dermatophagoides farinae]
MKYAVSKCRISGLFTSTAAAALVVFSQKESIQQTERVISSGQTGWLIVNLGLSFHPFHPSIGRCRPSERIQH